jgi:hypothetical protein
MNSVSNCGSKSHPWRLEAPVGQRIDVSLLDFTGVSSPPTSSRDRDVTCYQYGYVVEKYNKKNASICASSVVSGASEGGANPRRESTVFVSETNRVDIVFLSGSNTNSYNFLLKISGMHRYIYFSALFSLYSVR